MWEIQKVFLVILSYSCKLLTSPSRHLHVILISSTVHPDPPWPSRPCPPLYIDPHMHLFICYSYIVYSPSRPLSFCLEPATHSRLTHLFIFLYTISIRSQCPATHSRLTLLVFALTGSFKKISKNFLKNFWSQIFFG